MPSALETLVKILKLEQDSGFQDKAVIGGLRSFGEHWAAEAHGQAKRPEHHVLIDELADIMNRYADLTAQTERPEAVKYMLGRITGRVPPPGGLVPKPAPEVQTSPPPEQVERQPEPRPEPRVEPSRSEHSERSEPRPPENRPVEVEREAPPPRPEPAESRRPAPEPMRRVDSPNLKRGEDPSPEADGAPIPRSTHEYAPEPMRQARREQFESEPPLREVPLPRHEATRFVRPIRRKRGQADPHREIETLRAIKQTVANINGVGPKMAEKMQQVGINTIEDLLYCFPRRYY